MKRPEQVNPYSYKRASGVVGVVDRGRTEVTASRYKFLLGVMKMSKNWTVITIQG